MNSLTEQFLRLILEEEKPKKEEKEVSKDTNIPISFTEK